MVNVSTGVLFAFLVGTFVVCKISLLFNAYLNHSQFINKIVWFVFVGALPNMAFPVFLSLIKCFYILNLASNLNWISPDKANKNWNAFFQNMLDWEEAISEPAWIHVNGVEFWSTLSRCGSFWRRDDERGQWRCTCACWRGILRKDFGSPVQLPPARSWLAELTSSHFSITRFTCFFQALVLIKKSFFT